MIKQIKLLLTAAVALVAIAAFASPASAFEATISPGGNFESASNGRLTFGSGITQIQCEVTLNGSLATRAGIDAGDVFGAITSVEIDNESCSGGTVAGILETPWTLDVRALLGTAPNSLTGFSFDINNASFELEGFFGVDCLYDGNAAGLQALTDTGTNTYSTGTQRALEEVTLPRNASSDFGCPATGGFRGTFDIAPSQSITVS